MSTGVSAADSDAAFRPASGDQYCVDDGADTAMSGCTLTETRSYPRSAPLRP
jgi:hypothetical protein